MPSSPATGTDSDSATRPDPGDLADRVPQWLRGVELVGEYQDSGLAETTYLVKKPGGQAIQVSRLVYLVLEGSTVFAPSARSPSESAPPSAGRCRCWR